MGSGVQVMASQKQIEVKYQQAQKTAVRPTLKHSAFFDCFQNGLYCALRALTSVRARLPI